MNYKLLIIILAIIIETLKQNKITSFKKLQTATNLSNDNLQKQLEALQKYYIIKGEITDPEDGSYTFYHLTKQGEKFHLLLLDFLIKIYDIISEPISDTFVIDKKSFKVILKLMKLDDVQRIFEHSKIVLIEQDYSKLKQFSYQQKDKKLENFLDDKKQIIISSRYNDIEGSTKINHYLRKIRKLSSYESRLVVTCIDEHASLITDDTKIQSAAKSLGILCTNSNTVQELNDVNYLWKKFNKFLIKKHNGK